MPQHPPGADRNAVLHARLEAALAAKGPEYRPRTHLWDGAMPRHVNRLIEAASPYLLQHAHNPVDWHPWGAEALAEAAARDCPIFLSAGYATCHWCHVMEEESFDNEAVAEALNSRFVPVKIDREEYPDLDHIFITATQLQQNHAGWPNSVWLTPAGLPFHTGGYFPKSQFLQVLDAVDNAWRSEEGQHEINEVSARLAEGIRRFIHMRAPRQAPLPPDIFDQATEQMRGMFNARRGGFSTSQQFPQEGFLLYLLDHWRRGGDATALEAVTRTLDAIASGGLHDQVGGGFHRYTVDSGWRTPHYEKMLYNQALLARAFIEGWEVTGNPGWERAIRRCFAYVARDMTDADGAFLAAEDADSADRQGRPAEGAFYLWTSEEVEAVTGNRDIAAALGLDKAREGGAAPRLAAGAEADPAALDPALERMRQARAERPRPIRDEKVIAGWNGLMIRALAEGAIALDAPEHAAQAARAGEALWSRLWDGARLARFAVGARVGREGALEDYAWTALGFLALADATSEARWRERADLLAEAIVARFADGEGRLKMVAEDGPFGPVYDSTDGATPSGESSAFELLARLARRGAGPECRARAEALSAAIAPALTEAPLMRPDALVAARILADGDSGRRRVLGQGALHVVLRPGVMVLDIAPGWHLTAEGAPDGLAPVALQGAEADWPEPRLMAAEFAEGRVPVLEGRIEVPVRPYAETLTLSLQLCSDRLCLAPEEARFRLS